MNKFCISLVVISPLFLTGCLHFADSADVNLKPDDYFASRNYILAGHNAFAQDIAGLVGRMAYKDANGVYQFMNNPLLEGTSKPVVKAVQSAYSYSSKIDKGYSFTGSFAFITPDITGKTAMDYELRDVATATVDSSAEPNRTQFATAATTAGAPSDGPWYWVRSVVLADMRQQQSVNLNGQTTVTGSGFSANGQIYDNPSAAEWIPLVSIDPVPMNSAADKDASPAPNPSSAHVLELMTTEEASKRHYVLPKPANSILIPINIQ